MFKLQAKLDTLSRGFFRCLKRCPPIYRFLFGKSSECWFIRIIFGVLIGAVLGYAIHNVVLIRLKVPPPYDLYMSGFAFVFLTLGYGLSVQIRCISLLVIPFFTSKHGRTYIMTFAVGLLLAGPIVNLISNGREITRTFSCVGSVLKNQSNIIADLKTRPARKVMRELKKYAKKGLYGTSEEWKEKFRPMQVEIEDNGAIKQMKERTKKNDEGKAEKRSDNIEKRHPTKNETDKESTIQKFEKKLDYACEDAFNVGVKLCKDKFAEFRKKCMAEFPWLIDEVVCFVFKLDIACQLVKYIPGWFGVTCDSTEVLSEGFAQEYFIAKDAAKEFQKHFNVSLSYEVHIGVEPLQLSTYLEIARNIELEYQKKEEFLKRWMDFAKRLLAFLFVRVILNANGYHWKYVTKIRHDNHYITAYFRHIDARRFKKKKRCLLPMKRFEKAEYIAATSWKLMGAEAKALRKGTLKIIVRCLIFVFIFFIDHLIYVVLHIVKKHSHIEYVQKGVHVVDLEVEGEGPIALLIRKMLDSFNTNLNIEEYTTNVDCLPKPKKLPGYFIRSTMQVFFVMWLFLLVQAYALRLRRVFCSFFYPKREKRRTLFLYNSLLRTRKGVLKHLRRRVRMLAMKQTLSPPIGFLSFFRTRCPTLCCFLKVFGWGKLRCTICEDSVDKSMLQCPSLGCRFIYCQVCWIDVKKTCYACLRGDKFADLSESSSGADMYDEIYE